jgi:hypothetical protein
VKSLVNYGNGRLVELIVLNVGLQAGILSQRVFTMFVVMALVTTFLTTPIVSFLLVTIWYIADLVTHPGINGKSTCGVVARLIGTGIPLFDLTTAVLQMRNFRPMILLFKNVWSS